MLGIDLRAHDFTTWADSGFGCKPANGVHTYHIDLLPIGSVRLASLGGGFDDSRFVMNGLLAYLIYIYRPTTLNCTYVS